MSFLQGRMMDDHPGRPHVIALRYMSLIPEVLMTCRAMLCDWKVEGYTHWYWARTCETDPVPDLDPRRGPPELKERKLRKKNGAK